MCGVLLTMKAERNLQHCSEDLVSIVGAVKQDQLLLEAFVSEKPVTINAKFFN